MPNWVATEISVNCDIEVGGKLLARCHKTFDGQGGKDVLLSNFVNPASVIKEDNNSSNPDWHWRNMRLLGAKWDAAADAIQFIETSEETYQLRLTFKTAWHHPFPAIKGMAEQFFLIKDDVEMHVEFADEDPDSNFGAYIISTDKGDPNSFRGEGFHVIFAEQVGFDDDRPLRGRLKDLDSYKISYLTPKL